MMSTPLKLNSAKRCGAVALLVVMLPLAGCQALGPDGAMSLAPSASSVAPAPRSTEIEVAKEQFRAGNFGLAEEQFKRAVELSPQNAEAWLGLAACHDELRRFDLADLEYAKVQLLSGTSVALLNNRGYSQFLRGNISAARADLNAARALSPANADVRINLAAVTNSRKP